MPTPSPKYAPAQVSDVKFRGSGFGLVSASPLAKICQGNLVHIRQSRPDSGFRLSLFWSESLRVQGLGFQVSGLGSRLADVGFESDKIAAFRKSELQEISQSEPDSSLVVGHF